MKPLAFCPDVVKPQRLSDKRLTCERFGVVRVRGDAAYDKGFFWAFDNLDDAKRLCSFLVTEKLGAYVFDTVNHKKVFELKVPSA